MKKIANRKGQAIRLPKSVHVHFNVMDGDLLAWQLQLGGRKFGPTVKHLIRKHIAMKKYMNGEPVTIEQEKLIQFDQKGEVK